jgi:transitional endoplasmic reticulum ATPase
MSPALPQLRLVPLHRRAFEDRALMAPLDAPDLTLGGLLREHPALCLRPLTAEELNLPVAAFRYAFATPTADTTLYLPPGVTLGGGNGVAVTPPAEPEEPGEHLDEPAVAEEPPVGQVHPRRLSERDAVLVAHRDEIDQAAAYLESGLSVLVQCEKLLVEYLAREMAVRSDRRPRMVELTADAEAPPVPQLGGMGGNRRSQLVAALQQTVGEARDGDVVVVPHLDLLAGGSDASLTSEARDLTDLLYERSGVVLLGFTDPSLTVPDVLAKRFAVRVPIDVLPRTVRAADGTEIPVGHALVTGDEAALFAGFDADALYQNVAGMNAVRLRHGVRFAYHKHHTATDPAPTFDLLLHELRVFKASTSSDAFDVPTTTFDDIGGYDEVKTELRRAVRIVGGKVDVPENLRSDLVPRGFIFFGPPGTGKTLFAKAVARELGGTILVVSGPEITDKYVGESERKVRDIFAQARRNAPAVVVFDEFDSIAAQRTGRDDGGSRAGNAIVAQLLTELDGFRPATPVVIIGTTNRLDLIDEALLRPSRFRPIGIGLPQTAEARAEIARRHARHFGYDLGDELLGLIARATDGMNGDEIGSLFRDAKFDEIVGSGRPADPRRFGRLVGTLLGNRQQRTIDRARQPSRPDPERSATLLTWDTTTDPSTRDAFTPDVPTSRGTDA